MTHRVNLSEAISANRYITAMRSAVYDGIQKSLAGMEHVREYISATATADFGNNDASHSKFIRLTKIYFQGNIEVVLAENTVTALNKTLGKTIVSSVSFQDIDALGQAHVLSIELSDKYATRFSDKIIDSLIQIVYDNYDGEERINGFYDLCDKLSKSSRSDSWWKYVESAISSLVLEFIATVIHELVHVLQHYPQLIKKRFGTEYRSYLDKNKGELQSMIRKYKQEIKQGNVSPETEQRLSKLYYSSPQEIAAFAHNAAQNIIQSYGYADATTVDELQLKDLDASDIIQAIDSITNKWVRNPQTYREAAVRKRYIKMVYQEIAQYLTHRLEQLKSQTSI